MSALVKVPAKRAVEKPGAARLRWWVLAAQAIASSAAPNPPPRGTGAEVHLGRIASAVPWMKALIFSTSSALSLPVKSGIPRDMAGPLKTKLGRFSM